MAAVNATASLTACHLRVCSPSRVSDVPSTATIHVLPAAPARLTITAASRPEPTTPSSRARPSAAVTADAFTTESLEEYDSQPTPVLPSPALMAQFLVAYSQMLRHARARGDVAAVAGENVLERVRAGLLNLLGERHSAEWEKREERVQQCLGELEKDISLLQRAQDKRPGAITVQLVSVHCLEAARLLRTL